MRARVLHGATAGARGVRRCVDAVRRVAAARVDLAGECARVERGVAAHPCRGSICIERILRRLGPGDRSFGFSGDHPGSRRSLRRWEFIRVSLKVTETRD